MIRLAAIISFVFVLSACATDKSVVLSCDAESFIERSVEKLEAISSYQMNLQVDFEGMEVKTSIWGKLPDKLRMLQEISHSNTPSTLMIFDGKTQWVETNLGEQKQISKIELKGLVSDERPFDTSLNLYGSGLFSGEDYVGTVKALLAVYDYEITFGENNYVLNGKINKERFSEYVNTSRFHSKPGFEYRFVKEFGAASVKIDSETGLINSYSLGPSSQNMRLKVTFSDVVINPELGDSLFEYTPKADSKVIELTGQVKDLLK